MTYLNGIVVTKMMNKTEWSMVLNFLFIVAIRDFYVEHYYFLLHPRKISNVCPPRVIRCRVSRDSRRRIQYRRIIADSVCD